MDTLIYLLAKTKDGLLNWKALPNTVFNESGKIYYEDVCCEDNGFIFILVINEYKRFNMLTVQDSVGNNITDVLLTNKNMKIFEELYSLIIDKGGKHG